VIDDPVHRGVVGEEGNNAHLSLAQGTGQGIYLIDFFDHLGPASAGDPRAILLDEDEFLRTSLQLEHLPPVGIGVEAVISDSDSSLVGNVGGDPGNELQLVHPFHLFWLFPIPVEFSSLSPVFFYEGLDETEVIRSDWTSTDDEGLSH